jgi:hypothetical protein
MEWIINEEQYQKVDMDKRTEHNTKNGKLNRSDSHNQ